MRLTTHGLAGRAEHIRRAFGPALGVPLVRIETAVMVEGGGPGGWHDWADLPVRLLFADGHRVGAAWSEFDRLELSTGPEVPAGPGWWDGADPHNRNVRWVGGRVPGAGVLAGRPLTGTRVVPERDVLIVGAARFSAWSRLDLEFAGLTLSVFNALDENGYAVRHGAEGGGVRCLP